MPTPTPAPPLVNADASVPSLRTLGTGSDEAAAGDDARLATPSNAQTTAAADKIPLADGSGNISADWLTDTGVVADTYGGANDFINEITVDAKGRISGVSAATVHTGVFIQPLAGKDSNKLDVEKTVGAAYFSPGDYTGSTVTFRATAACGSMTATGRVYLYNVTDNTLESTLNISGTDTDKYEDIVTLPGTEKLYEVRIRSLTPADDADSVELYSAELRVS